MNETPKYIIEKKSFVPLEITPTDIPQNVMQHFEKRSAALLNPDDYKTGNFEEFQLYRHPDGTQTYLARQKKTYDSGNKDELTYFVDLENGTIIGWSTLRFNLKSNDPEAQKYFLNKPFVDWTRTDINYIKRNLATRRLYLMNQIALQRYGFPLYSSTNLSPEAKIVWEKLVAQTKAKKFDEDGRDRYKLLTFTE